MRWVVRGNSLQEIPGKTPLSTRSTQYNRGNAPCKAIIYNFFFCNYCSVLHGPKKIKLKQSGVTHRCGCWGQAVVAKAIQYLVLGAQKALGVESKGDSTFHLQKLAQAFCGVCLA